MVMPDTATFSRAFGQDLNVQEFTIAAYGRAAQRNIRVIFRLIHPPNHISSTALERTLVESSALFTKRRCKAATQRGADLVAALSKEPNAILIADGDAGLAGLLAAAVVP